MNTEIAAFVALTTISIAAQIATSIATVYNAQRNAKIAINTKILDLQEDRLQQEQHHKEIFLKWRIERIDQLMADLRKVRGELQYWQDKRDDNLSTLKSENLYGDAYAIMLSVGDEIVTEKADEMMRLPANQFQKKVVAISDGLKRMAELVNEIHKG